MKILLPIKRVVDYNVAVHVNADGTGVDIEHAKKSMNPFDAIAVEEAIRCKEQQPDIELIAVSIGGAKCQETLRQALSMGVDRAILIETEQAFMQAIEGLSKDLTLLIVAHRLTTLKNCTQIVELGEACIKRVGS